MHSLKKLKKEDWCSVLVRYAPKIIPQTHESTVFSKIVHMLRNLEAFDATIAVMFVTGQVEMSGRISESTVVYQENKSKQCTMRQ
jgi:hypothetical protein